jgi:hypothetical protein
MKFKLAGATHSGLARSRDGGPDGMRRVPSSRIWALRLLAVWTNLHRSTKPTARGKAWMSLEPSAQR